VAAVARHGRATGRDVSLCGDAGGAPALIPHLLRAGLRSLSMAPAMLARAKAAVAATDLGDDGQGAQGQAAHGQAAPGQGAHGQGAPA
jgi:phosphoenolpyruvate-protein phosphotransferase (PTS system enzyme I)